MPEISSLEEFKQLQRGFLASIPDQRTSFSMLIAEGDMVAAFGSYAGTHDGPLGDIPPTGKKAELNIMGVFRIEDGKIAELWVEWDNVAFLAQLGLMP
jgi:predicted ester cyclase